MGNRKGVILISTLIAMAVLLVLSGVYFSSAITEKKSTETERFLLQALGLAEAGVAKALRNLPNTEDVISEPTLKVGGIEGSYSAQIEQLSIPDVSNRYKITSTGSIANVTRKIEVFAELSISKTVETTGGLTIKGSSVDINPDGSYTTNSSLTFETVFGKTKDEVKSVANHLYNNPSNNQQPVDGITWVDLTGDTPQTATTYKIDSNWSGSGLLVVDGHRNDSTKDISALEISGTWNFKGIIWVIGKMKISGTPVIDGALFAESSVDVESTLAGNVTLNFDSTELTNAFSLLGLEYSGRKILSWYEP